jgi:murein DD-endopeptidase MepM/ murein hydrolase activator NlpD
MRPVLFIFSIFVCFTVVAQRNLKISTAKEGDATVFYAENNEFCPVSVEITLTLENLEIDGYSDGVFVIPEYVQHFRLFSLSGIRARRKTSYSYTYKAVFGDVKQVTYDSLFRYDLPFKKNARYRIEQGYNGRFTHLGENALDFNLPLGSQVRAARSGVVVDVVQNFTATCLTEDCKTMANHIFIYHADGTIAEYAHLAYNGARVAVGDSVNRGDLIALSGATGYARGPHLHFMCYLAGFGSPRSVRTRFRTGNGSTSAYLSENSSYLKGY